MASIDFKIIDRPEEFSKFAERWNALAAKSIYPSIFLTYEYLITAYETYGRASRLHIVFCYEDDQLLGAVPLKVAVRKIAGIPSRTLSPLASEEAESSIFLVMASETSFYETFSRYLSDNRNLWDKFLFPQLPDGHPFLSSLAERFASCRELIFTQRSVFVHPYVDIRDKWQEYYQCLKPRFLQKLRAGMRKLEEIGEPKLLQFNSPENICDALGLYAQLEHRSWKTKMESGIQRTKNLHDLYRLTAERYAPQGWVDITFLTAGDRVVAGGIAHVYAGRYEYMQTVYDRSVSSCHPGMILMTLNIKRAFDLKLNVVDLKGNYAEYKRNWANDEWKSTSVCVCKIVSGAGIAYFGRRYVLDPIFKSLSGFCGQPKAKFSEITLPPLTIADISAPKTVSLDHSALSAIIFANSQSSELQRAPRGAVCKITREEIEQMIQERTQARLNRDWARADEIRDTLSGYGIKIFDTVNETRWDMPKTDLQTPETSKKTTSG